MVICLVAASTVVGSRVAFFQLSSDALISSPDLQFALPHRHASNLHQFAFAMIQCTFGQMLPFGFHSMLHACRVGEASNPGPFRLTVVNPTAILRKVGDLLELKADLFCVSETSATVITQSQVTQSFFKAGFRSFWSLPVQSQFETTDNRPSLRGEALGTAIFSKIPARIPRVEIPDALSNSLRFVCCIVQFQHRDVLIISIYGFPGATRCQNNVRMNDLLLSFVWDIIQRVGLPFIVAGDFNEKPQSLPIFDAFRQIGATEIHQWFKGKHGYDLPATCREATRNDTAILHPWVAQFLSGATVHVDKRIGDHSPLSLDFNFDLPPQNGFTWKLPQSWARYAPPADDIAFHFNKLDRVYEQIPIASSVDVTCALTQWSQQVEHAIDLSLQNLHRRDSTRHPWNGLPKRFKGRCQQPSCTDNLPPTSIGGDRPGGYNPPCEIFSIIPKMKVRQVRRLTSLMRNLKACSANQPHRVADLEKEWNCILQAKGYGKTWSHWILGFEALPFLPDGLPSLEILDIATAITRIDSDFACQHEYKLRQQSFKYRMQLDKDHDFSKLTYRLMKDVKTPFLQEVPARHETEATLCRSHKGSSILRMSKPFPQLTVAAQARFGEATIEVLQQHDRDIHFRVVHGTLPTRGRLVQNFIASSDAQIFHEFQKFWKPYWQRDPVEDQFSSETCQDFIQELQATPLPAFPPFRIPLDDARLWMDAISELKNDKAIGICAWRHEELKCLPLICVQRLADIFNQAQDFAIEGYLMQARTILLPKCDNPDSMNQIRPITIISSLFRLFGKVVFHATTKAWNPIIPWNVMGGLPGKGVKDLALYQKFTIEECIHAKQSLGGYSLDLVKAFNTFNRRIMFLALTRLGMPERIVGFWVRCLSKLLRHPEIHGRLGPPVHSTTGAPEGDCISVLAMIALSTIFYFRLLHVAPRAEPFAYADNWCWMVKDKKSHFLAMICILNLAHALKVTINFQKSWHWGTTKEFRDFSQVLQLLFPSETDTIVTQLHVKDLGESVAYNKKVSVDFIRTRVENAVNRIRRLRHLPCTIQDKCLKIQTAAWTSALYAADTTYVGQKHFHDLRKAVVYALVGTRNFANAWVAVASISRYLTDPLLFVLCNMARLLRRLYARKPDLAMKFLKMVLDFQGFKPFGPASAFKRYCSVAGWTISSDGSIKCGEVLRCNLLHDTMPTILSTLKKAWSLVLIQNVDRKGVGDYIPDLDINHKVFQAFTDDDQKLLSFYFLGSFQVATIKAKWNADEIPDCPLCGLPDTRPHRYLECPAFQSIRDQHMDAVGILQTERPEWMYIPLARTSDDADVAYTIRNSFPSPEDVQPFPVQIDCTTFFTDGGAIHPQYEMARLASWAVVQDTAANVDCQKQAADLAFCVPPYFPTVKTVALGLVPGKQTAGRGELFALLVALKAAVQLPPDMFVRFVTDAQYVVVTINKIVELGISWITYKVNHADIILQISSLWDPTRFSIEKIKSHVDLDKAKDFHQLYNMIGNRCADCAATSSLKSAPLDILQLCQSQKDWYVREKAWLVEVCRYVLALNRSRIKKIEEIAKSKTDCADETATPGTMSSKIYGEDAFNILNNFAPIHYTAFCLHVPIPPLEILQAFLQGSTTALALCKWAQTLLWPPDLQPDYRSDTDWGITWMELYINFLCLTGRYMPIKVSGTGYNIKMVDFLSDEGMLLPKSKRSLALQTTTFQRALAALNNISGVKWFPNFHSGHVTSLKHLGWNVQATGIPCRPVLQSISQTMNIIHKLVPGPQFKSNMSDHVVITSAPPSLHIPVQPDVAMKTKWKMYNDRMKTRREAADGDD